MTTEGFINIFTIVISLIGAIITYMIIPYIKAKTTVEQQKKIEFWVRHAINGAEQIFKDPKMGKEKKEFVIKFLKNKGIQLSLEEIDILIEAIVKEMNKDKIK